MTTKFDPWKVLLFPHTSEKSTMLIEKENTIVFVVDRKSNKNEIKRAVEQAFGVKVDKVRTVITSKNYKKAYIKLSPEHNAVDIAMKLGLI
jgi:large subunit ribosomal protein L23